MTKNTKIISKKLIKMAKLDQGIRAKHWNAPTKKNSREMQRIDKTNREEFKEIFKKVGFISHEYGTQAQEAAFFIVQHMPKEEAEFMKQYLLLMKKDMKGIEINNFAKLCDRVELWQGKPQIYGTQFLSVDIKARVFKLAELYKPNEVNKRRKTLGLEPLEKYIDKFAKGNGVQILWQ